MNAIHVGYKNLTVEQYQDQLNKHQPIIVYCSIGVRSEEIGEKLKTAGFENVKNLRGGLFKWFNENRQILIRIINQLIIFTAIIKNGASF